MTAPPPPPPGQPGGHPGAAPSNNLVMAILVTIFCCLPLGIVAIVKSTQVNNLWAQGQHDAAQKAADDAKKFSTIGLVVGLVLIVLAVIINIAAVA